MSLKLLAHRFLPKQAIQTLTYLRKLSYRPDPLINRNREIFNSLNADKDNENLIRMRENIEFMVTERSKDAFEWFCYKSPSMVAEYDLFLERTKGCRRLLDVGCSHGVYSLTFCSMHPDAQVLSIDPSPEANFHFRQNVSLNQFSDKIFLLTCGVGREAQTVSMAKNWDHLEVSLATDGIQIQVEAIDDLCVKNGFEPDAIKIDIEGFELDAVIGASTTIRKNRPILFLEVHPLLLRNLNRNPGELFNLITSLGYSIQDCHSRSVLDHNYFVSQHHTFFTVCEPVG